MPWHVRRELYLVVIAAAIAALSIVVYVIASGAAFDLLATAVLLGAVAVLLVVLPSTPGRHELGRDEPPGSGGE